MTEVANGRLVRGSLLAQVETNEAAHRDRIVKRILGGRIGEVEPLLQKVDAEHHFQFARRATLARDRIGLRNQLAGSVQGTRRPMSLKNCARLIVVAFFRSLRPGAVACSSCGLMSGHRMRDLPDDLCRSSLSVGEDTCRWRASIAKAALERRRQVRPPLLLTPAKMRSSRSQNKENPNAPPVPPASLAAGYVQTRR